MFMISDSTKIIRLLALDFCEVIWASPSPTIDFIIIIIIIIDFIKKRYYFTKVFTKIKTGDLPTGRIYSYTNYTYTTISNNNN